jgi:GNAT superfamily N-acetyltransferase
MRIRLARAEERQALEDLQRRASLANDTDREALLAHPDAIELPAEQVAREQVFVAEADGDVFGFVALVDGDLDGLFVEPQLWGRGIGKALVETAVHEARRKGLSVTVIANPAALGFYQKCGFAVEGEAQTRFGPAIRMSR